MEFTNGHYELSPHHEGEQSENLANEKKIQEMIDNTEDHEKPLQTDPLAKEKLHNILTNEVVNEQISQNLPNVKKKGQELYTIFCNKRLVEK